jgi:predicted esterase
MEEQQFRSDLDDDSSQKNKKKNMIILVVSLILIVLAIGIILYFVLKPSSKDEVDESPFEVKKIDDTETQLIPKSGKYDYIFIFMHGLLGKPEEYLKTFNKKDGPIPDNFKIILPCASVEFVTRLNMSTTSWFDLAGKDGDVIVEEDMNVNDMDRNADRIEKIIQNEVKDLNYNYSRVFVGGFSQGACMSFHIGLRFNYTLGGIVTFCGIPISKTKIREGRENLNILSFIGGKDIYIPYNYSKPQYAKILKNFTNLNLKPYDEEEHAVADSELKDVKDFIKSLI